LKLAGIASGQIHTEGKPALLRPFPLQSSCSQEAGLIIACAARRLRLSVRKYNAVVAARNTAAEIYFIFSLIGGPPASA
jgi:hypothetical protein